MTGIVTTTEQLKAVLNDLLPDALKKAQKARPEKLYTKREAAKILGKAENTIGRMVKAGRIQTTADGQYISQQAIDNYINPEK
jgi:IS30 family transposase